MDSKKHLKKIATGSGYGLVGMFSGALVQFVVTLILVRVLSPSEYGVYTLALAIVITTSQIATLGFITGGSKYIASSLGRNEYSKTFGAIVIILSATFIAGGLAVFLINKFSDEITNFFKMPMLGEVILVFSISIWVLSVANVQIAIFNGFSNIYPGTFIEQFGQRVFRLIGVTIIAIVGGSIYSVAVVFSVASILVLIILSYLLVKKVRSDLDLTNIEYEFGGILLLVFPLFFILILDLLNLYSTRFLLGYYSIPEELGFFGAALGLSIFLTMPLNILGIIYLPVLSESLPSNKPDTTKDLYISSTKWVALISLVGFLFIQFHAEFLSKILFGPEYIGAANVLRVISFGYFFTTLCGPNTMTLIALEKSKLILCSNFAAILVTIILGLLLIQTYGAIGAAIAMTSGMMVAGLLKSFILFKVQHIHILVGKILKPTITVIIIAVPFDILFSILQIGDILEVIMTGIVLVLSYIYAQVFLGGIDEVELELIYSLERRLGGTGKFMNYLEKWKV